MSAAGAWTIVVPLVGACIALAGAGRRLSANVALLTAGVTAVGASLLAWAVWTSGAARYAVGGWVAPLGIELHMDGLSGAMSLLAGGTSVVLTIYARSYFGPAGHTGAWRAEGAFWPLWLLLIAALHALLLSADLFNLYVALELLTLCAVALISLAPERAAARSALRYIMAAFLGSVLYLLGVALLYAQAQTLDIALLSERIVPGHATSLALAAIIVGLAVKVALFPLHFWLPRAHASAPAPVSAMLSAFVVAAAFYVLFRLWFEVFAGIVTWTASQFIGALGAAAILWGSLQAIRQQRLKLMVAYSTVAQVGYFFLVFPLAIADPRGVAPPWALAAWSGTVYLVAAHALAKAAMFMAAGTIVRALGHDRIVGVSGIATHLPVTTYAFGIAGLSLIGLPPSGGFVGKWMLLSASLASGQWWWVLVIIAGGILTAGYVFLVLGQELSEARSDERAPLAPVPRTMEWTTMVLALASLFMGLRAIEAMDLLAMGSPLAEPAPER